MGIVQKVRNSTKKQTTEEQEQGNKESKEIKYDVEILLNEIRKVRTMAKHEGNQHQEIFIKQNCLGCKTICKEPGITGGWQDHCPPLSSGSSMHLNKGRTGGFKF